METTLIYNQQAGSTSKLTAAEILEALGQAGYHASYTPTSAEEELDRVLANAKELVVVAGGDGSLRAVATRLLDRDIRIVPLPMGTANNIGRLLGLNTNPLDVIAGLADPVKRDMDIGRVTTPDGEEYFLEAMGIGMFADVMKKYKPEDGKSIPRGIETILETLKDYQPKFFHINMDGRDLSDNYLMCEVMNTPTLSFHVTLAPDARPDDGLFDMVLIRANERESYLDFIKGVLTGTLESLPDVSIYRGRSLEIAWRGFPLQLDGTVLTRLNWEEDSAMDEPNLLSVSKPYLQVELMPKAIHFLIPKTTLT